MTMPQTDAAMPPVLPEPLEMRLFVMDARVSDPAVLVDRERIIDILHMAVRAAPATVLGEKFCVFPNGAVTGVLILAQSHLSIHTWPELSLANVDLLSYGQLDGEAVMKVIEAELPAERVRISVVPRGIA